MNIDIESDGASVRVHLKVVPNASRTRIVGAYEGALKVAVAAPPEKGRANEAVIALLAKTLGLRKNQLSIDSGATSARKTLCIVGAGAEEVSRALADAIGRAGRRRERS